MVQDYIAIHTWTVLKSPLFWLKYDDSVDRHHHHHYHTFSICYGLGSILTQRGKYNNHAHLQLRKLKVEVNCPRTHSTLAVLEKGEPRLFGSRNRDIGGWSHKDTIIYCQFSITLMFNKKDLHIKCCYSRLLVKDFWYKWSLKFWMTIVHTYI